MFSGFISGFNDDVGASVSSVSVSSLVGPGYG